VRPGVRSHPIPKEIEKSEQNELVNDEEAGNTSEEELHNRPEFKVNFWKDPTRLSVHEKS
jgi:hypothetical protein